MVLDSVSTCGLTPCDNRPISFKVTTIHYFACGPNLRSRYSKAAPVLGSTTLLAVQICEVED